MEYKSDIRNLLKDSKCIDFATLITSIIHLYGENSKIDASVLEDILSEGVSYVVDDTLTYENDIDANTETIKEKTKLKLISDIEQEILLKKADEAIYPFINLTYQSCKDQELGLGLDLQGGMSVTLEVAIYDLVRNLAGNSRQPSFQEPFLAALKSYKANEDFKDASGNDFISLL